MADTTTPTAPSELIRQGTLPNREIEALVDAVRKGEPWRQALSRLALPELSRKRSWFTNLEKAAFYKGLPTTGRRRALDIGAGSGVISAGLAPAFDRVTALEMDPVWCEFMSLRFAQDGVSNAEVINKGALPLPFGDHEFDLIVVNGVLEWIPESDPRGTPREIQLRFLSDVRTKLRPGGALGIAIENRWFVEHFRGYTPHGEPPYATILPRFLAGRRTRRINGSDYRTWIYGAPAYRRLLREAGFGDIDIQAVLPDYHQPTEVVPLSDAGKIQRHIASSNPLRAALLGVLERTRLLGYFTHSFYISARA
jgi:SAM-dependent methyltransferase